MLYKCINKCQHNGTYFSKDDVGYFTVAPPTNKFAELPAAEADLLRKKIAPLPSWKDEQDDWHTGKLQTEALQASDVTSDTVAFNLNYVVTGEEPAGSMFWDAGNKTVSFVLEDGVVGQGFEEAFIPAQNDTGVTLVDGMVATYAGSIGNSGNIRAELTVASASEHPMMTLGIITADIANGGRGKVTTRGKVRGIQTDGDNYGESWIDGDILFKSGTIAGGLTKVMPNAPVPAIPLAVVIASHATNGTLLVRPTVPQSLENLSDVNGTALTVDGQFPIWNNTTKYFDFTANINDYLKGFNLTTQYRMMTVGVDGVATESSSIITNIDGWLGVAAELPISDEMLTVTGKANISDDIHAGGIVEQSGVFGEIHVHDASAVESITTGSTYTKLTSFTDNGFSSNTTPDSSNDIITVTKTGIYRVSFAVSFTGASNNIVWKMAAFLDGVEQENCHLERKVSTGADIGSASFDGIIDITSADLDIDVRAAHDHGLDQDLTIKYANFNIEYLGET